MAAGRQKELVEDVLIEILIILPIKLLIQFRCVSKNWCNLIKSSKFINRHLQVDRKGVLMLKRYPPPPQCLRWSDLDAINYSELEQGHIKQIFSFYDPHYLDMMVSSDIIIPFSHDNLFGISHNFFHLTGPCNGLVCLAFLDTFILCNPALREFKVLPPLGFVYTGIKEDHEPCDQRLGIGFDPNTNVCKIVRIEEFSFYYTRAAMYSSSTNSWGEIHASLPQLWGTNLGLFFKNFLHWSTFTTDVHCMVILTFSISTNIFGELEFQVDSPFDTDKHTVSLMVWNDCLSMVRYQRSMTKSVMIEIWVMKEYGIKESSIKQFVIGPYLHFDALLFLNKELLLVVTGNGLLASLDLYTNELKEFDIHGHSGTLEAAIYKDSLMSPNQLMLGDKYN